MQPRALPTILLLASCAGQPPDPPARDAAADATSDVGPADVGPDAGADTGAEAGCTPGTTRACTCPDGAGSQGCLAGGTYDACRCALSPLDGQVDAVADDAPLDGSADAGQDIGLDAPDAPRPDAPADAAGDTPVDVANAEADACDAALATDPRNCGACGRSCFRPHVETATCVAGRCQPSCENFFADCDGDGANGCEVDVRRDPANCGACGAACSLLNASAVCSDRRCALSTCNAGFGNCDGMNANGCETDFSTTRVHCGSCGNRCSDGFTCRMGTCT